MVPLETWLVFCAACAALAITPGPNLLYLVSRTLVQGRAAGFVSLAGTETGLAFHVLAAAFGLSALLATIPAAYDIVRFAGAAYLAWLAVRTWREKDAAPAQAPRRAPMFELYRDGALTGILNPKVALFQLALFPQFVDPIHGSVLAQSLVLGATEIAIVGICDGACVLFAIRAREWFGARPRWSRWSKRMLAGVFAALAARLVLASRN
jgi:threonine/homoserine/homoserine lactone efflux protein